MTYMMRLTAIGAAKITAAAAGLRAVNLTQMAVGDGRGNAVPAPTGTELQMVREVYRTNLNSLAVNTNDPTLMLAEMTIPSAIGDFAIHEVGVYDSDGDLFAYANFPATWKPIPSDGSSRDMIVQAAFKVSNSAVVTLVVDGNLMIATRQWVLATITTAYLIPGGTTSQVLRKRSNTPGDVEWTDLTNINVTVDMIEEVQTIAEGQNVIDWNIVTHSGLAVYAEGVRLRADHWTKDPERSNRITLAHVYPAGTKFVGVQNEPAGTLPDPLVKTRNLSDVPDKGAARENLDVFSKAEARQLAPAGAIAHFARNTAPAGWLKANGAAVSRTVYADLFAALGTTFGAGDGSATFNLPDLRGEFLRGWDDSRGVDAARPFGSAQADANKAHDHTGRTSSAGSHSHGASTGTDGSHSHSYSDATVNTSRSTVSSGTGASMPIVNSIQVGDNGRTTGAAGSHSHSVTVNSAGSHSHNLDVDASGGVEARPRNVALLACIKF